MLQAVQFFSGKGGAGVRLCLGKYRNVVTHTHTHSHTVVWRGQTLTRVWLRQTTHTEVETFLCQGWYVPSVTVCVVPLKEVRQQAAPRCSYTSDDTGHRGASLSERLSLVSALK